MLPDFVRVKEKRSRRFIRAVNEETDRLTPVLNPIRTVRQYEGRRLQYQTVDGTEDVVNYDHKISSALRIQRDELPRMDERAYRAKAKQMAEELAPQATRHFFGMVDRWCEEAGTVTSAGGRPFDPMMLIESLEKTDIDFDEHGQPLVPTLVTHPDTFKTAAPKLAEAEQSLEFQRRWNELMARRWTEWRDREADRKLVD